MKRHVAVAFAVCTVSVATGQQAVQQTISIDGQTRRWVEYRPASIDPGTPAPVVIMLHPGASSPERSFGTSGWNQVADREGLLVVYPAATPGETSASGVWNAWDFDGAPLPNGTPANLSNRDDVGLIEAIIAQVTTRAQFPGDPARVFLTGFSSGAQMVNTYLGAGRSGVAASAPVSGGWAEQYGVPAEFVTPAGPTPVWIWAGENEDGLAPGGVSRAIHDEAQRLFWTSFNGTSPLPTETQTLTETFIARTVLADGVLREEEVEQTFVTEFYNDGRAPVRFTTVLGAGHTYHAGAAEVLWRDFFAAFGADLPCPADVNADGLLTPADFSAWIAAFNAQAPACDQNGDGLCTAADFSAWVANFNAGCP